MTGTKIDSKYIFASLFLSRIFVSFAYGGSRWSAFTTGDVLASMIVMAALVLLSTLPTVYYTRHAGGVGILEKAQTLSPLFSKVLAVYFAASYFILCLASSIRYELFASTVILPDTQPRWFMVVVIAAACYGASKGFQASSRAAFLVTVLIACAIVFIAATLTSKVQLDNITPLFFNGISDPLQISLYSVGATLEVSVVAVMLSRMKGKIIKNYYIWIVALLLCMGLLVFLTAGVLGEFGNSRMFPVYTVIVQAELGIFQRIDILLAGIWTLCIMIKICFFFLVIQHCLHVAFGVKNNAVTTAILGGLLLAATVLPVNKLTVMLNIFNMPMFVSIFLLSSVLLPLLIPLTEKLRNARSRKFKRSKADL